jgi:protein required for attachment to host cells
MHVKNRHKLFKKGEDKFINEFDAEYFVSTIRKVHILLNSMMDENQRFLCNYQQNNTLDIKEPTDTTKSSSSTSSDNGFQEASMIAPKLTAKDLQKSSHEAMISDFMVLSPSLHLGQVFVPAVNSS